MSSVIKLVCLVLQGGVSLSDTGSHPWLCRESIMQLYICEDYSAKLLCECVVSAFLSKQGGHAGNGGTNI